METSRLILRKPVPADAGAIFARYASDADVTRYLAWPRHRTIEDAQAFIRWSDEQWERWPAGPLLVESRVTGDLLGGTGLAFEGESIASTGYAFARDAWGRGYATEALGAMVELAVELKVGRLYALCHAEHRASAHVLEKCGFSLEVNAQSAIEFPNLAPGVRQRCLTYVWNKPEAGGVK